MRVLLRRRITEPMGKVRFALWARFEVSEEERALIRRYRVEQGYITIEGTRRDFYRAAVIAFLGAFFVTVLLEVMFENTPNGPGISLPGWISILLFFSLFVGGTWVIYEQLRLAIRIQDMLDGREFKHKSLALMARRERQVIGYGVAFLQFLEKLQDWEGTEVITLGEEHVPALRLVTDTYAPV